MTSLIRLKSIVKVPADIQGGDGVLVVNEGGTVTISVDPDTMPAGLNWQGNWNSLTLYAVDDAVAHEGSSYIAIAANLNSEPPSADWNLLAQAGSGTVILDDQVTPPMLDADTSPKQLAFRDRLNVVSREGDTMTGHLVLPTSPAASNAVRRDYVEANFPSILGTAGYALTGNGVSSATYQGFAQAGTGAVTRTWQSKASDIVNAADFGFDMSGDTDNKTKLENALAHAKATTGVLLLPAGVVRLDDTVMIPDGVTLIGSGMPSANAFAEGAYPPFATGNGTWFFFNHSSIGFLLQGTLTGSGATRDGDAPRILKQFGTYRTQPAPGVGAYTPSDHSWDIVIVASNEVFLSDIMLLNASRGIYVTGSAVMDVGSGRIDMRRIFGQPLIIGIQAEYVYDVCRINEVHFWPFWSTNNNVHIRTNTSANAIVLGRCDNFQMDQIFTYAYRRGIEVYNNATASTGTPGGTLGNAQFGMVQCDSCETGLHLDAAADNATMVFGQLVVYGSNLGTISSNARGFWIESDNTDIRIDDLKSVHSGSRHGIIAGTDNRMRIGRLTTAFTDLNATGLAQFQTGVGNFLNVDGEPFADSTTPVLFSGLGIISCNYWVSYTPVITVSTTPGSFAATATGWYRRIGETIDVTFNIVITTNSTATGSLFLKLPFTVHSSVPAQYGAGMVREFGVHGKIGSVYLSPGATNATIMQYDNTYIGATGALIGGTLIYRASNTPPALMLLDDEKIEALPAMAPG